MVAVERIQQFINIPSEAPSIISNHRPAANWPSMGTIEFQNLQVSSMYYLGLQVIIKSGDSNHIKVSGSRFGWVVVYVCCPQFLMLELST